MDHDTEQKIIYDIAFDAAMAAARAAAGLIPALSDLKFVALFVDPFPATFLLVLLCCSCPSSMDSLAATGFAYSVGRAGSCCAGSS